MDEQEIINAGASDNAQMAGSDNYDNNLEVNAIELNKGDGENEMEDTEFSDTTANIDGEITKDDSETKKDLAKQNEQSKTDKQPKGKPNEEFAERRRQQERKIQDIVEKEKASAYAKGKAEAMVGLSNPYTGEKIADETDARVFIKMSECEKAGFDPVTEMYKYERQQIAKQDEVVKTEKSKEEWFKSDKTEFEKTYPELSLNTLASDKTFAEFAKNKIGKTPLTTIYEDYVFMNSLIEKRMDSEKVNKQAKQTTQVGSLSTSPKVGIVDYESINDAEFDKYLEKAKAGELRK